uniref:Uncharacterized protein n=1 Tax=Phlebotomus papatasi TaxID=29031 RepID=A0A1B0D0Q9_PHLPP
MGGTAGDSAGITLNNNEEATKEEITVNEVNCDANGAEVEVGSNNVEITETKEETEEVREHSTMEEVVEKKEEQEVIVKVDAKVETSKKVEESPVKESKRILSHHLSNMHHGFKENGEEESHLDDVFAGFSVEDIREGYKSSMRNGEICASILNSRKSQPMLRGRLPIAESPCPAPPNHERLFRGYSFVSPHLLRLREAFSGQVLYSPSSVKPKVRDLMKLARSELPFFQKYQMDFSEVIGDGSFSICLKCIRRTTRDVYAVKVLKASHDAQSEIDNLIACQGHPQIVRFVEVIRDQAFTYIVLEYLDGGELFKRIQQSRRFTEIEASGIFTQIVKAVQFMHSKNIAHRDLKPENVIFASKKSNLVKVVDFGFAVRQDPAHTSVPSSAFTLEYAAPEVLSKTAIGDKAHMEACDLWSLGVILYTMLCGQSPFRSPSDSEESICGLVEKIRHGDFDTKTPAWRCVSPGARDLVTRLLNVDSERRMEMNELVNHSWLQGTTLRKSQLTPLTLAQDLASLDLTVKAIFDAYKHAQSKGFTMFEVENAKLSQRRRHKNSSHSSESDLV